MDFEEKVHNKPLLLQAHGAFRTNVVGARGCSDPLVRTTTPVCTAHVVGLGTPSLLIGPVYPSSLLAPSQPARWHDSVLTHRAC